MTTPVVEWRVLAFAELSPAELHDALRLRQDAFVVEQNCAFAEIDGRDPQALHLLGTTEGRLVAYARVFAPSAAAPHASIGRVVTHRSVRGTGLGRSVIREALRLAARVAPGAEVRLAAQAHLGPFYASLGFEPAGEPYLEDGILHQDMVRAAANEPITG